ncbi:class I SAM-dependent methyltransferase [Pseudonocardia sp.]|uniref:class I SAM-dependent methyltransferase n=1 Tax=Pseudonocardia sp. TaxID=60912 RepID=UPI003D11B1A9
MTDDREAAAVLVPAMKQVVRGVEDRALRILTAAGVRQSQETLAAQAGAYWTRPDGDRWRSDSHWRDADVFTGNDLWSHLGLRHLDMVERGERALGRPAGRWGRVVEWGCGGGANAIHFAPRADEFVGVDVAAESLDECGSQVRAVCDTPWKPVLVDVAHPEDAVAGIGPCDLWLSYYVFELLPSREYGARLLALAHRMLRPGGIASVQIKYSDGTWATRPRRWGYRSSVAGMTAYRVEEFWELATRVGFVPELVELRPQDDLDRRYAYFTLRRP